MNQNENIKEIIVNAIRAIPIGENVMSELSLTQRAMLRGKHPLEFAAGMVQSLPDHFMPAIIAVAHAISQAAKGESE